MRKKPIILWAPEKEKVILVSADDSCGMEKDENGFWRGPPMTAGTPYQFFLDGEGPFPDPRSQSQPEGVHGASKTVDYSRFHWTDEGWQPPPLTAGVIYELHIGTFSPEGTFEGAEKKLSYLRDIGVTHTELMPVNSFSGKRGWGYDGVSLYAPHEAYGGPAGLARFVDRCHQTGLAVILDAVYNHLGPEGNYLEKYGPYFTETYKTGWGKAVNFDGPGSDQVRAFFIGNALHWLKNYRIDGLRIDAVHAIFDHTAVHFLEELTQEVRRLEKITGKKKYLIAESDLNDPRIVREQGAGGYGMDAQWSDDFHHALHSVLTGEQDGYYEDYGSFHHLAQAFLNPFIYSGEYSAHRGRRHGRDPDRLGGEKFLAYIQNHDQIGNRAAGDRISHLAGTGGAKIAAALVFFSPYIPMIFQGEEWAASSPFQYFTDHGDPDLGAAVSRGRRREFAAFGWKPEDVPDPQAEDTFTDSKLRWDEIPEEPHRSVLDWYRLLIQYRKTHPDLMDYDRLNTEVMFSSEAGWFMVFRGTSGCICNFSGTGIDIAEGELPGDFHPEFSSEPECLTAEGVLTLPAKSVCIGRILPG
ncbi:MAG: malto-oligosyltrehalose trehalohydrolase [Spirochaetia bacterium]